jgi:hypothetical protein
MARRVKDESLETPPPGLVKMLGVAGGGAPRPYATNDFGETYRPEFASVIVPAVAAEARLAVVRENLPKGWVAWRGTNRWSGVRPEGPLEPVELVIGRGNNDEDIIRNAGCEAGYDGIGVDKQAVRIAALAKTYDLDLRGASANQVWFQVNGEVSAKLPSALARLCPDVSVEQHRKSLTLLAASCTWRARP